MISTLSRKLFNANQIVRALNAAAPERKIPKMRAWQIHSYGDLNELQMTAARFPIVSGPTDVLVKIEAASLNPIDAAMIGGYGRTLFDCLRRFELEFPLTLGRDFSGTIIDKGLSVDEFKIGDSVYGFVPPPQQGSHAETVLVDQSNIRFKPTHLNPAEAASIPYATMTAWGALHVTGELCLKPIQNLRILILGASGGVGTLAIQLLKSQGALVAGTCSSDAVPLISSLGADYVFDYTQPNHHENIAALGKFDIILDCAKLGYENLPNTWQYDKFITLNSPLLSNTDKYGFVGGLFASGVELLTPNLTQGKPIRWGFFIPSSSGFKLIDRLVQNKKINPVIHKVFKFDEALQAFKTLSEGHLRGKIVLNF